MPDPMILKAQKGQGIYHGHDKIPESAIIKGLSSGDTTMHEALTYMAALSNRTYDEQIASHEKRIGCRIVRDVTGSNEA